MNDIATAPTGQDAAVAAIDLSEAIDRSARRRWWRRAALIVGAIVLLGALFLFLRWSSTPAEAGYATEPARRGQLLVTVSATGNLQPTNQVEVGSEQSGLVERVFADVNDRVVRGQPLARLDARRLEDAITLSRAQLAGAEAQVAQARASRDQARIRLGRLEEVYRRTEGRFPAAADIDNGRIDLRRAEANVEAAVAQVSQARAQLSSAQTSLAKATIYSPVTGVVIRRQVDPGQTVAASFQAPVLFTIAEDLSAMRLEVQVDEADVGQVRAGQQASFVVDAYPGRNFPAIIERVDIGANTGSTSSTSASGTVVAYTAILRVQNPGLLLRPGMTATAEIVTSRRENVLLIPSAALRYSPEREAAAQQGRGGVTRMLAPRGPFRRGGQRQDAAAGRGGEQIIYVLGTDLQPRPVRVRVGESTGTETEIVAGGLRPGMAVITGRLAAGATERSQPRAAGGNQAGRGDGG